MWTEAVVLLEHKTPGNVIAANTAYPITEWTFGWELIRQRPYKKSQGHIGRTGTEYGKIKEKKFLQTLHHLNIWIISFPSNGWLHIWDKKAQGNHATSQHTRKQGSIIKLNFQETGAHLKRLPSQTGHKLIIKKIRTTILSWSS